MARYITKDLTKPTKGIDLKSSEIRRSEQYLTNGQNIMYDQNGNICKRNGFHIRVYGVDAFSGLTRFDTTDYKGTAKSELLMLGANTSGNPVKVVKNTFSITNTLLAGSSTFKLIYDEITLQYRFVVTGVVAADIAVGLGVGDMTLAGLIAALPITQTGVASGDTTVPAAYLEMKEVTLQPGEVGVFEYYTTANLVWGGHGPAPTLTTSSIRSNPQSVTVSGSIYWYATQTGTNTALYKYDGNVWYEAGLDGLSPRGDSIDMVYGDGDSVTDSRGSFTLNQAAAWVIDDGDLWAVCAYRDKAGAYHYGDFKSYQLPILSSSYGAADGGAGISIFPSDIPNNKNCRNAIVNGVQAGTLAITVDAGHAIFAGDVAYFYDSHQHIFIEREVVTIGATSITISTTKITEGDAGGVVSLWDNAIISNNFRIQYWKQTSLSSFSGQVLINAGDLIAEVPLNISSTGPVINPPLKPLYPNIIYPLTYPIDRESYISDGTSKYPPVSGRLVSSTSNGASLVISGNVESNNTVYCSMPGDCESFAIGRNSFVVDESVTALGSSGSVTFVGTANKTYAVTGDIPSLNFRVEKITDNLGVESAASVAEVDEGTICFNTHRGVFSLSGGRELVPVGAWPSDSRISIIEPFFTYRYPNTGYYPRFDLAKVSVIKEKKLIINSIPSYYGTTFFGPDSVTWVYDYSMGGWFVWVGVDFSLGCAYWDDKMWVASQGISGKSTLSTMTDTNSDYDYADHGTAIESVVQFNWEALGNQNLYKKFLWLTVYTPSGNGLPYELNVKTWANYEVSRVTCFSNPTALHTEFYKDATPPGYTVTAKLKTGKLCSMMVEVGNNNANEGLWIAGMQMDIAPAFQSPSSAGGSDA